MLYGIIIYMRTYLITCGIFLYRMQQQQADAIKHKITFLDPVAICESRHRGPMLWKDDHDELKMCSTAKERKDKRKKEHDKIRRTIGAYISLQMQRWQDREVIWVPYYLQ